MRQNKGQNLRDGGICAPPPAVIAEADPSWAQWEDVATSQVAASAILTAILVPIITSWWAKKFGCPKFPKDEAQKALFEKH